MTPPRLEDYFEQGSMWQLLWKEDPYTFVETYRLLRNVFGYDLFYVNYGYWPDGIETEEPGRRLTYMIGDALGLEAGDRVLEAGSGLGQASIDSYNHYDLDGIVGLNVCEPQVKFANALAAAHGLEDHIEHRLGDACVQVNGFEQGEFDHAFAQECIGHFPDPLHYLESVRKMLPSGGRMAITIVSAPKPPPPSLAWVQNLFFGTVPKNGEHWEDLFRRAGFKVVRSDDITDVVFAPMFRAIRHRLEVDPESLDFPLLTRLGLLLLLNRTENGIRNRTMGYHIVVGEVP